MNIVFYWKKKFYLINVNIETRENDFNVLLVSHYYDKFWLWKIQSSFWLFLLEDKYIITISDQNFKYTTFAEAKELPM